MNTSTNVVHLRQPEELEDPLTDILRSGARRLLAQAVELEAETFLAGMQALKLPDGRDRLVRHGYGPERMIQTGIGPVAVSRVKIRDRGAASETTGSASHRRSCPSGRAARGASTRSCQPSTCAGSRQETSRRRLRRCSAGTHRTCRLQ